MIEMTSSAVPTDEPDDEFDTSMSSHDGGGPNVIVIHQSHHPQRNNDEEEALGLMSRAESLTKDEFSIMSMDFETDEERMCSGSFRILVLSMSCVLIVALLAVLLPGIRNKSNALEVLRTPARIPVDYGCHSTGNENNAESYTPDMTDQNDVVSAAISQNMTEFLQTFREKKIEDWGKTYNQLKEGMHHFKSTYYPPYLQDGATIYESSCGIGLNLYMTLEILKESHGIENLFVYGNELLSVSANKANAVFDHIPPARSHKGVICTADSSHLGFVPSNAFDLVYTGYISPLLDPLHFNIGTSGNYDRYTNLCKSDPTDHWAEATLNTIAQERQNDWYGNWVAEMARIAKPGVPVIVEQVSLPYCDAVFDWGGVRKEWWYDAVNNNTYGWNVDPSSLVIEDDTLFNQRYHVFMLKHRKRDNNR